MTDPQDSTAGDGSNLDADNAAGGTRRTSAELVADLLREKAEAEAKLKEKFDAKIAKARKSAVPIGERRRAALDIFDRLRDAYRTAYGNILLDEALVDRALMDIVVAALTAGAAGGDIKPEALAAALLVLQGEPNDASGAGGDETPAAQLGHAATEGSQTGLAPADAAPDESSPADVGQDLPQNHAKVEGAGETPGHGAPEREGAQAAALAD